MQKTGGWQHDPQHNDTQNNVFQNNAKYLW